MFGGRSVQLGRIFGIRIGANPSWFVILFLGIVFFSSQYRDEFPGHGTRAYVLATITTAAFLLSVLLHELGHAVTARLSGLRVLGVELWMFGGFTNMERDATTPGVELRIAAAGPAVTAVIAALAFAAGSASIGAGQFIKVVPQTLATVSPTTAVLGYVAYINALLLVFNLLPGLPLDGGRIARAIIWWRTGNLTRATALSARIGQALAYLLGAFGLWEFAQRSVTAGLWSLYIAFLIGMSARQYLVHASVTERISGLRVEDVMDPQPVAVPSQTKLDRAIDDFFVRYGWDWFPVVDVTGVFLGLVSRDRVEAVPEALRAGSSVDEVTDRETRGAFRIGVDEPLEALLSSEGLRRLGAVMAVDSSDVLRGVVTIEQVKRALDTRSPAHA
jgi:Zn-dependent protease